MRLIRHDPPSCVRPDDADVAEVCMIFGGGAFTSSKVEVVS